MKGMLLLLGIVSWTCLGGGCTSGGNTSNTGDRKDLVFHEPPEEKIGDIVMGEQRPIKGYSDASITPPVEEWDFEDQTATNTFTDRKIGGAGLCAPEAQARMMELLAFHKRKNGKVNRSKVARTLNREGYRRWDGKKFKVKDIPKYEY
ncbi:MAG: hypothetical protein H6558_22130 [Lewinellaceae bacterium]|nr:hypothetical protein [Lewinellaceae bacterium]MCB9296429.1 hypothetical protein [Lewinellaceae bacterium]